MHIPFSLNTALSVPPPSPRLFQVKFFSGHYALPSGRHTASYARLWRDMIGPNAWIIKARLSLAKGAGRTVWDCLVLDRTPAAASYALS